MNEYKRYVDKKCVYIKRKLVYFYERNKKTHTLAHRLYYSNDMIQENDPKKKERERERGKNKGKFVLNSPVLSA